MAVMSQKYKAGQHIVVVDYFSCCIFKRQLLNLTLFCVIEALKDIFCDVGSPDKIITDNAHYFVSEEFTNFMMDWSIQHLTSSPRFPHGNAHAEKVVGIVKEMYTKCHDVKLGLLFVSRLRNQIFSPSGTRLSVTSIFTFMFKQSRGTLFFTEDKIFYHRQKVHQPEGWRKHIYSHWMVD